VGRAPPPAAFDLDIGYQKIPDSKAVNFMHGKSGW